MVPGGLGIQQIPPPVQQIKSDGGKFTRNSTKLQMNWLKNAFSNEEFSTPNREGSGLSKAPKKVTATNPRNGKTTQVVVNSNLQ